MLLYGLPQQGKEKNFSRYNKKTCNLDCFSFTGPRSGAKVLQILTNVKLLHFPDEGCSATAEILRQTWG